jgi:WD40 repeat protein
MVNRVGQQLGQYRLLRLLGEGQTTQVYLGEHIIYRTRVAVKCPVGAQFIASNSWGDGDIMLRFNEDMQTSRRLKHRHIARVFANDTQDNIPFLTMEYASGGNMRQPKGQVLPLATAVPYVQQLAEVLQYAHDHKYIHRSLIPENILVGPQHELLLCDFIPYIEGVHWMPAFNLPRKDTLHDAPYKAPEKIQGHATPASDQYALAAIVYEWLCGVSPMRAGEQHVARLSSAVEVVVLTALAQLPEHRFASVQAFAHALALALTLETAGNGPMTSQPNAENVGTTVAIVQDSSPLNSSSTSPTSPPSSQLPGKQRTRPLPMQSSWQTETLDYVEVASAQSHEFTYKRHTEAVKAVQWSPDGQYIASGGVDGSVQVWDARAGRHLFNYNGHDGTVFSLSWSPTSSTFTSERGWYIASAGEDTTVQVWKVGIPDNETASQSETPVVTYRGHADDLCAVAWSPDGRRIASGGMGTTVQVWDATTGEALFTYRGHLSCVYTLAWSPDSTRIASVAGDTTIHIWNATTGDVFVAEDLHSDPVNAVAWSPDGRRIASGDSGHRVCIWDPAPDPESTLVVPEYSDYSGPILVLAWSPDGTRLAAGCEANVARVKEVFAFKYADSMVYDGHTDAVQALSWSPDGTHIASASDDATVQVWFVPPRINALDPMGPPEVFQEKHMPPQPSAWDTWPSSLPVPMPPPPVPYVPPYTILPTEATLYRYSGHTEPVMVVAWSPAGDWLASSGEDGVVILWDALSGEHALSYSGHMGKVKAIVWSPTGERLASAGEDGSVQVWDAITGACLVAYSRHQSTVNALAWSPGGGYLASASDDGSVQVWNAATSEHIYTYTGHLTGVHLLGWSYDSQRIASSERDGHVHVWEAITGERAFVYRHPTNVRALAWSPSRHNIAVAGENDMVLFWDAVPESTLSGFSTPCPFIHTLSWSSDGAHLALAGDGRAGDGERRPYEVWVCEAGTGRNMLCYQGHTEQVTALAWSPDSQRIASASLDNTVAVWTITVLDSICPYRGHFAPVSFLAWSPDGNRVASVSTDFAIQVWDSSTGARLCTYQRHNALVEAVRWQADGKTITSYTVDDEVHVWDATTGSNISAGRLYRNNSGNALALKSPTFAYTAYVYADGIVEIASAETGSLLQVYRGHTSMASTVTGKSALAERETLLSRLHSSDTGAGISEKSPLVWSPDTRIASVGQDGIVHIWDGLTGQMLCSLQSSTSPLVPLGWSPDGARILTLTEDDRHTLQVWNTTTGQCVCSYSGHEDALYLTSWSLDGTHIASASIVSQQQPRYAIQVWNAATGEAICRYEGHASQVASIVWSSPHDGCGPSIASVGVSAGNVKSSAVQVWDATIGKAIMTYDAHSGPINMVSWSPDGMRVASASDDHMVRIWDVRQIK